MEILDATIHLACAFDIGYEIDLEQARPLLQGVSGALPRRKRTPESIQYRPAPLRVPVQASSIALPGSVTDIRPSRGELTVFDFGAISLVLQFPVHLTADDLLALAGELADTAPLTAAVRELAAPWIERLRPAVIDFEASNLGEEYLVFQVGDIPAGWLDEHLGWVAGLVRLEAGELSREEILEATRLRISYTPHDLVTLDWAAGFVADRDCADTLQIIEFANVQLLEYRHIDDRLDDRLEAAYRLIRPARRRRGPAVLWRLHGDAVRNIRELEIEATSLFERADNALKLIGDQYLSRFDLASSRFHLRDWQQSIRRKLDVVGDVYDLLIQQAGGVRMELLEITVVALITLEILLALWEHMRP